MSAETHARIIAHLRVYAANFTETIRHLGDWMALPTPDATALAEVIWAGQAGDPLTPARLARRIGLTSGATTNLINRLEAGGHLVRSRESTDRRIVTLRATPASATRAELFFVQGRELDAVLHDADPGTLEVVEAFLATLASATTGLNARLRAGAHTVRADPPEPGAS
jgi:DNA-binding MarR family transcriptional regulator